MDNIEALKRVAISMAHDDEESIVTWLERIRHEIKLANALKIMELRLAHSLTEREILEYFKDGIEVINAH